MRRRRSLRCKALNGFAAGFAEGEFGGLLIRPYSGAYNTRVLSAPMEVV